MQSRLEWIELQMDDKPENNLYYSVDNLDVRNIFITTGLIQEVTIRFNNGHERIINLKAVVLYDFEVKHK
jgi:hypothetical protein